MRWLFVGEALVLRKAQCIEVFLVLNHMFGFHCQRFELQKTSFGAYFGVGGSGSKGLFARNYVRKRPKSHFLLARIVVF